MTVNYNTCHKPWNTCMSSSLPQFWFGYYSRLSATKYAWLNIAEGEWHIGLRTMVRRVNVGNGSGSFKMKRGCCDLNLLSYLPDWVCVFSSFCCGLVHELDLICRCNDWVHPNTPYKRQKTIMLYQYLLRLMLKFPSASFTAISLLVHKGVWTLITGLEYCIEKERWTL